MVVETVCGSVPQEMRLLQELAGYDDGDAVKASSIVVCVCKGQVACRSGLLVRHFTSCP